MRSLPDQASVTTASTTEEPGAGKLHAGVCAGAPGNGRSYRERRRRGELNQPYKSKNSVDASLAWRSANPD